MFQAKNSQGGHTLPRKIDYRTRLIPPSSQRYGVDLSTRVTGEILQSCRKQGITFGQALYVAAQIAHGRILHRRRDRMTKEEWEHRINQPNYFCGPIDARRRMDPVWQREGGTTEVFLCPDWWTCTLPPLSEDCCTYSSMEYSLPSKNSFFDRCHMLRRQAEDHLKHPLLFGRSFAKASRQVEGSLKYAKAWRKANNESDPAKELLPEEYPPPNILVAKSSTTFTSAATSFGAVCDI